MITLRVNGTEHRLDADPDMPSCGPCAISWG